MYVQLRIRRNNIGYRAHCPVVQKGVGHEENCGFMETVRSWVAAGDR